jgi:hypothetical protein
MTGSMRRAARNTERAYHDGGRDVGNTVEWSDRRACVESPGSSGAAASGLTGCKFSIAQMRLDTA